jgi:hypothetical protein
MTYTPHKPPIAESPDELRKRIPGWGVDLDLKDRPSMPKLRFQEDLTGAHWEFPERQPERYPRERSPEHELLTPVFGTAQPPSGVSGAVRRHAYRYSEGRGALAAAHVRRPGGCVGAPPQVVPHAPPGQPDHRDRGEGRVHPPRPAVARRRASCRPEAPVAGPDHRRRPLGGGGLAGVLRRQEVAQAPAVLSHRGRPRPVPRSGRPGSVPPARPVTSGPACIRRVQGEPSSTWWRLCPLPWAYVYICHWRIPLSGSTLCGSPRRDHVPGAVLATIWR